MSKVRQKIHSRIGKMKLNRGHILFSYNEVTGEIKKTELVRCDTYNIVDRKAIYNDKVHIEANCYYEQAFNNKNFIKRLKRGWIIK